MKHKHFWVDKCVNVSTQNVSAAANYRSGPTTLLWWSLIILLYSLSYSLVAQQITVMAKHQRWCVIFKFDQYSLSKHATLMWTDSYFILMLLPSETCKIFKDFMFNIKHNWSDIKSLDSVASTCSIAWTHNCWVSELNMLSIGWYLIATTTVCQRLSFTARIQ